MTKSDCSRRDFVKTSALAATGSLIALSAPGCASVKASRNDGLFSLSKKEPEMDGVQKYGASLERLQSRDCKAWQIVLSGKWEMCGRDPEATTAFCAEGSRVLPGMNDWVWHEVTTPGSVRSGLLEAGVIDDPYWNDNAGKSLWTEDKTWWFRKTVSIPERWSGKRALIGFDGLDYYSSVWFNGQFLGDHEGMYGGPVYDVTRLVRLGEPNEIVAQIHPGGTNEPGKAFKGWIFMKWHYQTDLSPRGIWRKSRLVATGPVRFENPFVKTLSITEEEAEVEITVDVINTGEPTSVSITNCVFGENFKSRKQSFTMALELPKGESVATYKLSIPKVKQWQPHGMGDPNLYRLALSAEIDGEFSDAISTTFGVRTLEFLPVPGLDSDVNSLFMCKINGKIISMRGAGGFGCHDQLYRFHDRKDAWFIKAAQSMNFNFIRVHGSGLIATDEFYDLCDRMGMMVWQEFLVSNMGLSGLHFEVWRTQTVKSIVRLRNHPSLVYWCGGNEFNPDQTADETKNVVDMFQNSVRDYDGTRPFSRAAQYVNDPHYNDQSGFYGGQKVAACSEYSGGYAGNLLPQRSLKKFLPEEDVTRWPPTTKDDLPTVLPADALVGWDNSRRGAFVEHTALTGRLSYWCGDLMIVLPQWILFGIPHTMEEAFEISQLSGGYATAYTMETFRSRWPHPSLYASWDYAPIWPMSLIWGPVDYYGNVLPCAYYYKRALEPLHVLMQFDPSEHIKAPVLNIDAFPKVFEPGGTFSGSVYVVSDLDHSLAQHSVEIQILGVSFDNLHSEIMTITSVVSGPSSALLGVVTWDIPASLRNQTALVCVSLRNNNGDLASRSIYPIWITAERGRIVSDWAARRDLAPRLTELKDSPTTLSITPVSKEVVFSVDDYLQGGSQRCAIVALDISNTGNNPAFHAGVYIDNADCRYLCDDNFFALMPGETKRITITIDNSIRTFYDYVAQERLQPVGSELRFAVSAWNAPKETVVIAVKA